MDNNVILQIADALERRGRNVRLDRSNDLDCLDEIDFKSRYRLSKHSAEALLRMLDSKIPAPRRVHGITVAEKMCTALRFFASGSFQLIAGDLNQVSQPSACRAILEVSKALAEMRPIYINMPQTDVERHEVSQDFYRRSGFPGVVGAIDCSHIPILSPGGSSPEIFRCRKTYFSINVQTVSDNDLFIRDIVACWPGSTHDSTIFDNSRLRATMETEVPHQYHLLGDNGYGCRSYLLTPFLQPRTLQQIRYNQAHIRARNAVERSYGLWKKRFACLSIPLRCDLQNALTIIVATAVLHNFALGMDDDFQMDGPVEPDDDSFPTVVHNHVAGTAKRNSIITNFFSN